jgi:hypothetical protein
VARPVHDELTALGVAPRRPALAGREAGLRRARQGGGSARRGRVSARGAPRAWCRLCRGGGGTRGPSAPQRWAAPTPVQQSGADQPQEALCREGCAAAPWPLQGPGPACCTPPGPPSCAKSLGGGARSEGARRRGRLGRWDGGRPTVRPLVGGPAAWHRAAPFRWSVRACGGKAPGERLRLRMRRQDAEAGHQGTDDSAAAVASRRGACAPGQKSEPWRAYSGSPKRPSGSRSGSESASSSRASRKLVCSSDSALSGQCAAGVSAGGPVLRRVGGRRGGSRGREWR